MVGRTPEYLGKKIQAWEATWAVVAILDTELPDSARLRAGVHAPAGTFQHEQRRAARVERNSLRLRFEAANNNGSAFAGLNANTPFYNLDAGSAMFIGRFVASGGAGHRRPSGRARKPSRLAGNAADARLDLRLRAARRHYDRRGADFFPGPVPGAHRGARIDAGRPDLLTIHICKKII